MSGHESFRSALAAAMAGAAGALSAADRLCMACVELLDVDGAAVSVMIDDVTHGTVGSSGPLSRRLDELQFTFGEGPCLDAYSSRRPVFAPDLGPTERRWPAFSPAAADFGVRAVFALPAAVAATPVGVLDLFRRTPGPLSAGDLAGGLLAAELAAAPLLQLVDGGQHDPSDPTGDGWSQLAALERVEVYQATGMVMGQLGVGPAEALVRLRAHAFATERTASEVAWAIVERRLTLETDPPRRRPDEPGRPM